MNRVIAEPEILLPLPRFLPHWSVVACDQFTSDRGYWDALDAWAGENPSTLRLILPECYLGDDSERARREQIGRTMRDYYNGGVFTQKKNFVFVERTFRSGKVRHGLIAAVDLESYEYKKGNKALVRATEGTVESRLPPRVEIRNRSLLELPHIMLFIDDPRNLVLDTARRCAGETLYNIELPCGGGRVCGTAVNNAGSVESAFDTLAADMKKRYGEELLLLVGDGNHSLAAAKKCYETAKAEGDETAERKRYALCEIVNLYDGGIAFEPIHRAVFGVNPPDFAAALARRTKGLPVPATLIGGGKEYAFSLPAETISAIALVQEFMEEYTAKKGGEIDYIHGDNVLRALGNKPDCVTVAFSPISKTGFTEYIIQNGVLPKKTFSMGHAEEKRYYLEARRIGKI